MSFLRGQPYTGFPLIGEKLDGTPFTDTDGTPAVELSLAGASFVTATNAPVYVGKKLWTVDLDVSETDVDYLAIDFDHASMRHHFSAHFPANAAQDFLEKSIGLLTIASVTDAQTFVLNAPAAAVLDYYVDSVLWFVSGALAGQGGRISMYSAGRQVTLETVLTSTPSAADKVVILGQIK